MDPPQPLVMKSILTHFYNPNPGLRATLRCDIAIIGGGIIGTATAMILAEQDRRCNIVLIEKEPNLAMHQTGHNSGVIHSGIYYKPDSLKAKLCVEGAHKMVQFAKRNNIRYELCGKVIVATREEELPWLNNLWERGLSNGVAGLELINSAQIKEFEPHANGIRGIYSPSTGIVDYQVVTHAMAKRFIDNGGRLALSTRVTGIKTRQEDLLLITNNSDIQTRYLVNCSGLYSDTIALMMRTEPSLRIVPFRGEYYEIRKENDNIIRNLLYPVPDPQVPFLGVHFTRTINGILEAGPNAVLAFAREGYRKTSFSLKETMEMLGYTGFWKMAKMYWKTGILEFYRSISKRAFLQTVKKLIPEIREESLIPGPTGVRAQCVDNNGFLVDDFRIVEGTRSIHVLNVPSPAATASLKIAEYIVSLVKKSF